MRTNCKKEEEKKIRRRSSASNEAAAAAAALKKRTCKQASRLAGKRSCLIKREEAGQGCQSNDRSGSKHVYWESTMSTQAACKGYTLPHVPSIWESCWGKT